MTTTCPTCKRPMHAFNHDGKRRYRCMSLSCNDSHIYDKEGNHVS